MWKTFTMVLKSDQERVMGLLKDTITLLCKNGLNFKSKFCVDAVIGVTVDEDDLFYISVKEVVKSEKPQLEGKKSGESSGEESAEGIASGNKEHKRRRRKRRIKNESGEGSAGENGSGDEDGGSSGVSDEESSRLSGAESSSKRVRVKQENEEEEESDQDIVFIKQELDDNSWSQSQDVGATGMGTSFQNFSGGMQPDSQQDQNFPSLAEMNLTPLDAGEGSSGMWSSHNQQQQQLNQQQRRLYVPRGPRTPSNLQQQQQLSQQGGAMMPQGEGDSQQQRYQYMCSICNKGCTTKGNLKRHENAHRGIYANHCPFCQKGYLSADDLKGHLFLHTGVMAFKCEICGEPFQYKRGLRNHSILSHSS